MSLLAVARAASRRPARTLGNAAAFSSLRVAQPSLPPTQTQCKPGLRDHRLASITAAFAASRHKRVQQTRLQHTQPPQSPLRRLSGQEGRIWLVWGVIFANILTYLAWRIIFAPISPAEMRDMDPRRLEVMKREQARLKNNWLLSQRNLREGRWWTLFTAAFSHTDFQHLLFNMIVYHLAATTAFSLGFGPTRIAFLAAGSILASSAGSIWDERTRKMPREGQYLGASGMIEGMLTAVALTVPWYRVSFLFIPVGIPILGVTGGVLAWDLYSLTQERGRPSKGGGVGYAAHLSGAAFGALYYFLRLRTSFGRAYGGVGTGVTRWR
jgi:membrane associated rhomboid family serine protease